MTLQKYINDKYMLKCTIQFWTLISFAMQSRLSFISIYTLSDLGVLSNLIGSLSLANEHYSPPTEWIMRKPNKNKMAGVNAWIERSIKSIFNGFLLKMLLRSLPVYILKQLFFSISVNSGRIIVKYYEIIQHLNLVHHGLLSCDNCFFSWSISPFGILYGIT